MISKPHNRRLRLVQTLENRVDLTLNFEMSIQLSLPMALHMRAQVTYNMFSNQRWRPGEATHPFIDGL